MLGPIFSRRRRPGSSEPPESIPAGNQPPSPEAGKQAGVNQPHAGSGGTHHGDEERGRQDMLKLLEEIDDNRKSARSSSGSKMIPLRTDVWDASQGIIRSMDPGLRRDLEAVYADIRLLNQLVWLSSEFHRSSRAILSRYADLSLAIAKSLDDIVEAPRHGFTST